MLFLKTTAKGTNVATFFKICIRQIVKGSDDLVRQKTFIFSIHNTHGWKLKLPDSDAHMRCGLMKGILSVID